MRNLLFFPIVSTMQVRGDEIRRQRIASGYGLRAFAKQVGVSPSWLSRIETAKAHPSPDVLGRIAVALADAQQVRVAISKIADSREGRDEDSPG